MFNQLRTMQLIILDNMRNRVNHTILRAACTWVHRSEELFSSREPPPEEFIKEGLLIIEWLTK